jgi:hypothetical protein
LLLLQTIQISSGHGIEHPSSSASLKHIALLHEKMFTANNMYFVYSALSFSLSWSTHYYCCGVTLVWHEVAIKECLKALTESLDGYFLDVIVGPLDAPAVQNHPNQTKKQGRQKAKRLEPE